MITNDKVSGSTSGTSILEIFLNGLGVEQRSSSLASYLIQKMGIW